MGADEPGGSCDQDAAVKLSVPGFGGWKWAYENWSIVIFLNI